MMQLWRGYWFAPVNTTRPFLLGHGLLLILAFDIPLTHLAHASRYGLGDFNVAHFSGLDRVLPQGLSPAGYSSLLIVASALACLCVSLGLVTRSLDSLERQRVGLLQRWMLASVLVLYTVAWSSSMLDSYQHHYLLSILLMVLCFFPTGALLAQTPAEAQNWGAALFSASLAVVYGYAAWAKLEPSWQDGDALLRVAPEAFREIMHAGALSSDEVMVLAHWVSQTVPVAQGALALGYLSSPVLHRWKWGRRAALMFLVLGVLFHSTAEFLGLKIGWFSYYMIWTAVVTFMPPMSARRLYAAMLHNVERVPRLDSRLVPGLVVGASAALLIAGARLDLPGSTFSGALLGALLAGGWWATGVWKPSISAAAIWPRLSVGAIFWAAAITLVASGSELRFDYYRFAGGAHARLGQWEEALVAYEQANRYAPRGKNRLERQREAQQHVDPRR